MADRARQQEAKALHGQERHEHDGDGRLGHPKRADGGH